MIPPIMAAVKPLDLVAIAVKDPRVGTTFAISPLSSLGLVPWPGHGSTLHHLPEGWGRALRISFVM